MQERDVFVGDRERERLHLRRVAWALSAKVTSLYDGCVGVFGAAALIALILFLAPDSASPRPRDIFWMSLAAAALVRSVPHLLAYRAQVKLLAALGWADRDADAALGVPPPAAAVDLDSARSALALARRCDRIIGRAATVSMYVYFLGGIALDLAQCGIRMWR